MDLHRVILLSVIFFLATLGCGAERTGQSVKSGLDVLVESDFELLSGKKVGVVTNQTGINARSEHIADLLHRADNVILAKLYAPEHGIRGTAEGGEQIEGEVDAKTGVSILSLYGETRKPTPEMLDGIDVLLFDIQDVGARFYTYISTMSLAMEAAAEHGIPFVVLDRPNPVGGEIVEGPVLEEEYKSFVGIHPIALRYGMTIGELATMFNEEGWLAGGVQADLTVVRLKNWRRDMLFDATQLPWVKPSPNMPSPTTALLYPGIGLLEATNISEGRGTSKPFENVGAPWIDPAALAEKLAGFGLRGIEFDPIEFMPVDMPGTAMNPKFEGQLCRGLFLQVTEPQEFCAVEFGIHLIVASKRLYPDHVTMRERGVKLLTGSSKVAEKLMRGDDPRGIIASWQPELKKFLEIRQKYLLYD